MNNEHVTQSFVNENNICYQRYAVNDARNFAGEDNNTPMLIQRTVNIRNAPEQIINRDQRVGGREMRNSVLQDHLDHLDLEISQVKDTLKEFEQAEHRQVKMTLLGIPTTNKCMAYTNCALLASLIVLVLVNYYAFSEK